VSGDDGDDLDADFGLTKDAREDVFQLGLTTAAADELWRTCEALTWPPRAVPGVEGVVPGLGCAWHRPADSALSGNAVVYRQATRADVRALRRDVQVVVVRVLTNEQLPLAAPPSAVRQLADAADGSGSDSGDGQGRHARVVERLWQAILLMRRREQP
jgi:hypothetical protein